MLTKMAMLFFIIALALILTGLGNTQRGGICTSQADFVAKAISGTISNVVNSPVEDERKILAIDPVLSIGKTDYDRYEIQLTNVVKSSAEGKNSGFFSIYVKPTSEGCSGSSSAPYEGFKVSLLGPRKTQASAGDMISMRPSDAQGGTKFLVVIKCKEKKPNVFPPTVFVFIQDCFEQSGDACLGFSSTAVNDACGYGK